MSSSSRSRLRIDGVLILSSFRFLFRWASGTAVHYNSNLITATESSQSLASRIVVGEVRNLLLCLRFCLLIFLLCQRFESHRVVSLADARPWHVGDLLVSDGRWRVINFAGDVREQSQRKKLEKVRFLRFLPCLVLLTSILIGCCLLRLG